MQEGPIDIDQYEYATGAQIRMKTPSMNDKTPSGETGTLGDREARKQSRS